MLRLLQLLVIVVLLNHLGLSRELAKVLRLRGRLKILVTCSKCATFWLCFGTALLQGRGLPDSLMLALLFAYSALWLELLLSYINSKYNDIWQSINHPDRENTNR